MRHIGVIENSMSISYIISWSNVSMLMLVAAGCKSTDQILHDLSLNATVQVMVMQENESIMVAWCMFCNV